MAALSIFQKFPLTGEDQSGAKSMRWDHPDFADVNRTDYSLGIITDFKKLTDDPVTVESKVKVTGDWGESDWLPIFYHPKKSYWNGTDVLATDFDETNKFFKQAWQSFRCGDEVAVMLQAATDGDALKPVAVIAFADGVPRIGENVFKLSYESKLVKIGVWSPFHGTFTMITDFPPSNHYVYVDCNKQIPYGIFDEDVLGPDDIDLKLEKEIIASIVETETWSRISPIMGITLVNDVFFAVYFVPVGAILYIIQFLGVYENTDDNAGLSIWHTGIGCVLAGIYSDEIKAKSLLSPIERSIIELAQEQWWDDYPGFTKQTDFNQLIRPAREPFITGSYDDDLSYYWSDIRTFKIYVRPHTKAELIAASMWPGGGS